MTLAYRLAVTYLSLLLLTGCTSKLLSPEPNTYTLQAVAPKQGITYHLPVTWLSVNATTTTTTSTKFENTEKKTKSSLALSAMVELNHLPDTSRLFRLDLDPGAVSKDDLTIQTSLEGMLTSLDLKSEGRGGEVVKKVASIAGSVVATMASKRYVPRGGKSLLSDDIQKCLGIDINNPMCCGKNIQDLDDLTQNFIKDTQTGCTLWKQQATLEANIAEISNNLINLENATLLDTSNNIWMIKQRVEIGTAALKRLKDDRSTVLAAFQIGKDEYASKNGIGSKSTQNMYSELLTLDMLPEHPKESKIDTETVDMILASNNYSLARDIFIHAGVIVTMDEMGAEIPDSMDWQNTFYQRTHTDKDQTYIYYRRPIPVVLRTYVAESEDMIENKLFKMSTPFKELTLKSRSVEFVYHPRTPPGMLTFNANAFAERDLSATFTGQGVPTTLKRVTTSWLESATAAASEAPGEFLGSAVSTLTGIDEYRAAKDALRTNAAARKAAYLQEQINVLNAQISLEGANTNKDTLLRKQALESQLALVEQQLALDTAKAGYAAALEHAETQSQIDALMQRIELLETQQRIKALEDVTAVE